MTTDVSHWTGDRRNVRSTLFRMAGMGLKALARAAFAGRRPRPNVSDLSPWLLRDIGLQRGPVTRIPAEGGASRAADSAFSAWLRARAASLLGLPANDNATASRCAA